ncbi:DUF4239 domain-containing protein [candidate division KSB1 bacterium]|nr:DUF4239 domain-containing protein [candidate division KSB1 bacterium]
MILDKNCDLVYDIELQNKLDLIHKEVGKIIGNKEIPPAIANEIMHHINDALDFRGDWTAHAKERIPGVLWFLVILASIAWCLSYLGLAVDNKSLTYILSGFTFFIVTTIIFFISDIDDPTDGVWKFNLDPFRALNQEAQKYLDISTK